MSMLSIIVSSYGSDTISVPEVIISKRFTLTGQSNCNGSALNADATSAELAEHPNFYIFQENDAYEPLNVGAQNNYSQTTDTFGLEMPLSEILIDEVVYMDKIGVGSTSIVRHTPTQTGDIYARWKNNFVDPATAYLDGENIEYERIIVYFQGEEDAKTETAANLYGGYFDELITTYKSVWGNDVKIRVVEINAAATPYSETINDVFAAKALIEPNLQVIPAKNLGTQIHYQYDHMKIIGQRLVDSLDNEAPEEGTLNSVTED